MNIPLYRMADFLPNYEDIRVVAPQLSGPIYISDRKTSKSNNKKKKNKRNRQKKERNAQSSLKPKALVVDVTPESIDQISPQKEREPLEESERLTSFSTMQDPLNSDEETLSTSSDLSSNFEDDADPQGDISSIFTPMEKTVVIDLRPALHQRRWNLLNDFWEADKLTYQDFTTLFEGFGGEIKQTKGGSSHVKLLFTTPEGLWLINGIWRPHPTPVFRQSSLKHLRSYFENCGLLLENYQIAR